MHVFTDLHGCRRRNDRDGDEELYGSDFHGDTPCRLLLAQFFYVVFLCCFHLCRDVVGDWIAPRATLGRRTKSNCYASLGNPLNQGFLAVCALDATQHLRRAWNFDRRDIRALGHGVHRDGRHGTCVLFREHCRSMCAAGTA
jgi:hypothetical protein